MNTPPGRPVSGKPVSGPSRYKIDAVIALAVLVLLLALWRVVNRPAILGAAGSVLVTNVFGPAGLRLAQNLAGGDTGGNSLSPTTDAVETAQSPIPTNPPSPPGLTSTVPRVASGTALPDDAIVTNQRDKVIVYSAPDFSYTNEPVEGAANSADGRALAQRLNDVGAKGGDIQFSLSWNNLNDLDLHCIDPKGTEIWYENTNSATTGGMLDHDANASHYTDTPVENIYWPAGGAPAGIYQVFVVHFAKHGGADPTSYTVRVLVLGQTNYFTHAISYTGQREKAWICTIKYDPTNPDPSKRRRFLNPGRCDRIFEPSGGFIVDTHHRLAPHDSVLSNKWAESP